MCDESELPSALKSLQTLMPATRDLDAIVNDPSSITSTTDIPCMTILLQHGARINYAQAYLTGLFEWAADMHLHSNHSEAFIELLRAADTDFSGVRQRIASVDKNEWPTLNLAVLDQKLSQPLTLQTLCVIRVRRQLRSAKDCGLWARIEELPALPTLIKDRLKLRTW